MKDIRIRVRRIEESKATNKKFFISKPTEMISKYHYIVGNYAGYFAVEIKSTL